MIHLCTVSVLSLHDIAVGFDQPLVEGISFDLNQGELVALTGRNGCGKTTLLRTILGFHPALKGSVLLDGRPVDELSVLQKAKRCSAVLTTRPSLGAIRVYELVALGQQPYTGALGRLTPIGHEVVDQAMNTMGVTKLKDRMWDEISDGERQKVMIARALAQETPLIIMDEPLAFLDYPSKVEVLAFLQKIIRKEGKTILFSSHEIPLLSDRVDRVLGIDEKGKWFDERQDVAGVLERAFHAKAD